MKRRNLLLSALAAATIPRFSSRAEAANASLIPEAGIPLIERRYDWGPVASYMTAEEAAARESRGDDLIAEYPELENTAIEPTVTADAEFVTTGNWLVFVVKVAEARDFRSPYQVPTEFGKWGWTSASLMTEPGEWLTWDEAIAEMVSHNRRSLGCQSDEWAIVVEVGKPQGQLSHYLEVTAGESYSRLDMSTSSPVRLYRHAK